MTLIFQFLSNLIIFPNSDIFFSNGKNAEIVTDIVQVLWNYLYLIHMKTPSPWNTIKIAK